MVRGQTERRIAEMVLPMSYFNEVEHLMKDFEWVFEVRSWRRAACCPTGVGGGSLRHDVLCLARRDFGCSSDCSHCV